MAGSDLVRRAGDRRARIEIQSFTTPQNEFGEPVRVWSTLVRRWAKIEPVTGREFWAAEQVNAEITHTIEIDPIDGLSPRWRIRYRRRASLPYRYFDIKAIRDVLERDWKVVIMARERAE